MSFLDQDLRSETGELRCPTCGARQAWSDTCRRCKCDLSLLHQLQQRLRLLRRRCLSQLRDRRLDGALDTARRCYQLSTDAASARLLALCYLLNADWAGALRLHDAATPTGKLRHGSLRPRQVVQEPAGAGTRRGQRLLQWQECDAGCGHEPQPQKVAETPVDEESQPAQELDGH